jgi:Flp pilus assembly protein TadG
MRLVTRERRKRQRGNALVEFALAFGFLFPVVTGTFQFGYAFFVYNELQNAVRAGARHAAFRGYNSATTTPSEAYATAVKNTVVYGNPGGGATPIVPNLSTDNVSLTVTFVGTAPARMTVAIQNYTINAFLTSFTINKPSATFNYVGVYAPSGAI